MTGARYYYRAPWSLINAKYKNYLRSAAWQKKRQEVFLKYGKRCYACGSQRPPIHVHHLSYVNLGREPLGDLMPLCKKCHQEITKLSRSNRRLTTRQVTMAYVKRKRDNGRSTR